MISITTTLLSYSPFKVIAILRLDAIPKVTSPNFAKLIPLVKSLLCHNYLLFVF